MANHLNMEYGYKHVHSSSIAISVLHFSSQYFVWFPNLKKTSFVLAARWSENRAV